MADSTDEPELPGAGAGACSLAPAPSSGAAAVVVGADSGERPATNKE